MKKHNKLTIKVRDLEPLKDVIGGKRRRGHRLHAGAVFERRVGEYRGGLGLIGYNRIP
jgi:hypothetical protein